MLFELILNQIYNFILIGIIVLNFILLTLCYLLFHIICHQILQLVIKMEALFSRKVSTIRYEAHLMICH